MQNLILFGGLSFLVGIAVGYFLRKQIAQKQIQSAEAQTSKLISEAQAQRKELILSAKDEALKIKEEAKKEEGRRLSKIEELEQKIRRKEEILEQRSSEIEKRTSNLELARQEIVKTKQEISELRQKLEKELEKIAALTKEQARDLLFSRIERESKEVFAKRIIELENIFKEESEKKAKEIIGTVIGRCASIHTAEMTVSTVLLPSDEMKGRIIGREGRNIQAFEKATGVDLIVDDTPEAVVISCFDPVRRAVAKLTLERLILDGRIHPARIEEAAAQAEKEVAAKIKEAGERAVIEAGVVGLPSDLVKLLGRLYYRTSYGQNVLRHSIEASQLAEILAAEIGADIEIVKKAALLHDIGKAISHEISGSHAQISRDIAKKYGLSDEIIHAIEAHHEEVEPKTKEAAIAATIEGAIVQAADAISASRPGARRETLESYIKRLTELENIANSFAGVQKSYAIQAGREVRIIVEPEEISDLEASKLAFDIAAKIEKELEYPGQIKVNVIRETRFAEFAK